MAEKCPLNYFSDWNESSDASQLTGTLLPYVIDIVS